VSLRGDLQGHESRWAYQNIQSLERKDEDWFTQTLHRTNNELIAETHENDCTVIAFKNFTDIRERTSASWSHK
jgi:hypothetical protein